MERSTEHISKKPRNTVQQRQHIMPSLMYGATTQSIPNPESYRLAYTPLSTHLQNIHLYLRQGKTEELCYLLLAQKRDTSLCYMKILIWKVCKIIATYN